MQGKSIAASFPEYSDDDLTIEACAARFKNSVPTSGKNPNPKMTSAAVEDSDDNVPLFCAPRFADHDDDVPLACVSRFTVTNSVPSSGKNPKPIMLSAQATLAGRFQATPARKTPGKGKRQKREKPRRLPKPTALDAALAGVKGGKCSVELMNLAPEPAMDRKLATLIEYVVENPHVVSIELQVEFHFIGISRPTPDAALAGNSTGNQ